MAAAQSKCKVRGCLLCVGWGTLPRSRDCTLSSWVQNLWGVLLVLLSLSGITFPFNLSLFLVQALKSALLLYKLPT